MKLRLERFTSNSKATLGLLFLDGTFFCFTLEDEYRTQKVMGETRIPAGTYRITPRTEGGMIKRYQKRFPEWHEGMIWLRDVPGFQYVYMHIGNTDEDTAGCILVASGADSANMRISHSTPVYTRFYKAVYAEAKAGNLEIEIVDRDR